MFRLQIKLFYTFWVLISLKIVYKFSTKNNQDAVP